MGAGLLANTVCQSLNELTDPPYSRASPLPHKPTPTLVLRCFQVTQFPYSYREILSRTCSPVLCCPPQKTSL
ncbi:hypothetical protein DBR46_17675 [Pseudomonas sp. KBW05]|nr:hypothetical protein DBR46_17675 [Pseudomonas sp. KBW05]